VSGCYLTADELLFSYVIEQTNYIQWNEDDDNDDVRFVLDQRAELDLYKASLLKQQSADRNGSPKDLHPDILSWFQANQYLLLLLKAAYLADKQYTCIPIF
jgi:hypothetical protein